MPLNKPGKRITPKKLSRIPNVSAYTSNIQSARISKNYQAALNSRVNTAGNFGGDGFPTDRMRDFGNQNNSDAFGIWLRDNAITTLTKAIFGTDATKTSIDINAPTNTGGGDYLIRKGDTFYIYDQYSYKKIKLTADEDLLHSSTSLDITSTSFLRGKDLFRSGAYVIADNKVLVERVSNAPNFKRFELNNTQYQALNSGYTLLAAETHKLHIPLSATIIYNYDTTKELKNADLIIGHNYSSKIPEQYWSLYENAFFKVETNMLIQMTAGTYANKLDPGLPVISILNDGIAKDLKIYSTAAFNGGGDLVILLYYKTILI